MIPLRRSKRLFDKAVALSNEGQDDEAIELYLQAIALRPKWSKPHYNLGLIYKYRLEWKLSFYHNQKAAQLAPEDEAGWWNLGIASTALQDWRTAREAWNFFRMKLPVNDEEVRMNLGQTPIRLDPDGRGEVVWCKRIDPARALIDNIPYPESGRRYNDLLLNDGAPVGYRTIDDVKYPVLNELQLLVPSSYKTFTVLLYSHDDAHLQKLQALCEQADMQYEDWTSTVRMLCRQCSEGVPHEHHDSELSAPDENGPRRIGIAAQQQTEVEKVLQQWQVITLAEYSDLQLELE
jgi:tetratricopeptide (TPR) repeat protein